MTHASLSSTYTSHMVAHCKCKRKTVLAPSCEGMSPHKHLTPTLLTIVSTLPMFEVKRLCLHQRGMWMRDDAILSPIVDRFESENGDVISPRFLSLSLCVCGWGCKMSRVDQQFAMGGLSFLSSAKVTTLLRDESQQMLMMDPEQVLDHSIMELPENVRGYIITLEKFVKRTREREEKFYQILSTVEKQKKRLERNNRFLFEKLTKARMVISELRGRAESPMSNVLGVFPKTPDVLLPVQPRTSKASGPSPTKRPTPSRKPRRRPEPLAPSPPPRKPPVPRRTMEESRQSPLPAIPALGGAPSSNATTSGH